MTPSHSSSEGSKCTGCQQGEIRAWGNSHLPTPFPEQRPFMIPICLLWFSSLAWRSIIWGCFLNLQSPESYSPCPQIL